MLTDITNPSCPFYVGIQHQSNTQFDFLEKVLEAIETNYLKPGDILFCDNARIHLANGTFSAVQALLDSYQIRWIFLPTYSPEFNPCELIFGQVKKYLREYRQFDKCFEWELARALSQVSTETVKNYYYKCVISVI